MEYEGITFKEEEGAGNTPLNKELEKKVEGVPGWLLKHHLAKDELTAKKMVLAAAMVFFLLTLVPLIYSAFNLFYPGPKTFEKIKPIGPLPAQPLF